MKNENKKRGKIAKIAKGTFIGIRVLWTILGIIAGCIVFGMIIFCLKTVGLELKGCFGL